MLDMDVRSYVVCFSSRVVFLKASLYDVDMLLSQ